MGLNTVLFLLNDRLGDIEKVEKLGEKISAALNGGVEKDVQGRRQIVPGLFLVSMNHADFTSLIAAGGNMAQVLTTVPTSLGQHQSEEAAVNIKIRELCIRRGMPDPMGTVPKPSLKEVQELAKSYGWRLIKLRRKSDEKDPVKGKIKVVRKKL